MPRTTIDLDASVLRDLRRAARAAHKSLGAMASELLATVLRRGSPALDKTKLAWHSKPMSARVDLEDKEALYRALDSR